MQKPIEVGAFAINKLHFSFERQMPTSKFELLSTIKLSHAKDKNCHGAV
jgi:hypothetical protein